MSSPSSTLTIKNRWSSACTAASLALILASFSQSSLAQDQAQQSSSAASTAQAAPVPDDKEVRIGDLGFRVLSLKVSDRGRDSNRSKAAVTMRIHNYGTKPVSVDYNSRSGSVINEHGYTWKAYFGNDDVSGISIANDSSAGLDSIIDPSGDIQFTINLYYSMGNGQSLGEQFDLQAVFSTYESKGEGRVNRLRSYSVSMLGLRKATVAEQIGNMPSDIGSAVKKSFGGLFK